VAKTREANPNWRGGRSVTSHGYVLIRQPDHPRADCRGYVYEHILVAEQTLGRLIERGEIVHHRNGVKHDNRPENLDVKASRHHHAVEHRNRTDLRLPGEANPDVGCACGCGTTFPKYDGDGRPRRYVSGHNLHGGDHG
jgi:hypothetical protein